MKFIDEALSKVSTDDLITYRDDLRKKWLGIFQISVNPECMNTALVRGLLEEIRSIEAELSSRQSNEQLIIAKISAEKSHLVAEKAQRTTSISVFVTVVALFIQIFFNQKQLEQVATANKVASEANDIQIQDGRPWLVVRSIDTNPKTLPRIGDVVTLDVVYEIENIGDRPAKFRIPKKPEALGLDRTKNTQSRQEGPVESILLPGQRMSYPFKLQDVLVKSAIKYALPIEYGEVSDSNQVFDKMTEISLEPVNALDGGIKMQAHVTRVK